VRVALLNVRDALGIREESFDFELELVGELAPLAFALERQALLARALQDRYELAGFRGRLALLKAQQGLDRSLALPTLAGFVGYSLDSGFDPASGASRWFEAGAWSGSWNAGLSLSVPLSALLPWSKESAAQRRTALQLENLNVQYAGLESGARIAVESGLLKVAEQEARIASGRKGLALAQRLYESAEEQYRGGYISSTDLKDAQLGLNGAQLALAQAVFAYNQNVLELMDAAGMDGEQEP
jgi:outer membrane protein TolC